MLNSCSSLITQSDLQCTRYIMSICQKCRQSCQLSQTKGLECAIISSVTELSLAFHTSADIRHTPANSALRIIRTFGPPLKRRANEAKIPSFSLIYSFCSTFMISPLHPLLYKRMSLPLNKSWMGEPRGVNLLCSQ